MWPWNKKTETTSLTTGKTSPKQKSITIGGYSQKNNVSGQPTNYSRYYTGWVFANLNAIASSVAKIELDLYKVRVVGGEIVLEEVESHPVLDLLDRMNAFTSFYDGIYTTQTYKDMSGDSFWVISEDKQSLYILESEKVTVNFAYAQGGNYDITSYTYKTMVNGKPHEEIFPADRVVPFKNPNPFNPIRGRSIIEAAITTIETDNNAEEWNRTFFENNATPDTVLRTDQRISSENMRRLEADLRRRFGGSKGAHKTMILEGGLDIKPVSSTQRDMEFLAQQQWTRDKIMAVFGNTKVSLGITEDVNRANAESSLYMWLKEVIMPKMQAIVDSLNEFYLPRMTDEPLIFGFDDPFPEDKTTDIAEATAGYGKWLTVNEIRDTLGMDEIEGGDEINSTTVQPITPEQPDSNDETPKSIRNVDFQKRYRQLGVYEKQMRQKELKQTADKIAKESVEIAKKIVANKKVEPVPQPVVAEHQHSQFFDNDKVLGYWNAKINKIESIEGRFANTLNKFLNQLEEKTLNAVLSIQEKGLKKAAIEPIYDIEDEVKAGFNLFKPLFEEAQLVGGLAAQQLIDVKLNYKPSAGLRKKVSANVKKFTTSMLETDREKLTDLIVNGIADGRGVDVIARDVADIFDTFRKSQVDTIVRTEILRTANLASVDAYKQSDVVVGKQWLNAADACEFCLQAAKDYENVSLTQNFANKGDTLTGVDGGTMTLDYGALDAPPLHPNCRCDTIPVLADEFAKELNQAVRKSKKPKAVKTDDRDEKIATLKAELEEQKRYVSDLEGLISE